MPPEPTVTIPESEYTRLLELQDLIRDLKYVVTCQDTRGTYCDGPDAPEGYSCCDACRIEARYLEALKKIPTP